MRVAQGVEDAGGIFEQVRGAKECMLEATKMRSGNGGEHGAESIHRILHRAM